MKLAHQQKDSGFTLVALLLLIAVGSVLMASIGPTWGFLVQRDREEELIFRGDSYALAIERYQKRFNKLPTNLNELMEQHMIRRLYEDPITEMPFELLVYNGASRVRESELEPTQRRILRGETPGTTSLGIIGVVSMSDEKALRPYKGKEYYNEWEFYAQDDQQEQGGAQPAEGQAGSGRDEDRSPSSF